MLSDKQKMPDYKINPGVIIGKEEMAKFIDFVEEMTKKDTPAEPKN
jgi:4-hydroxy-3-methylbut-2-en-1-yl diphosphate synthase IspG/GcpE